MELVVMNEEVLGPLPWHSLVPSIVHEEEHDSGRPLLRILRFHDAD
jgi:hypothetical protein